MLIATVLARLPGRSGMKTRCVIFLLVCASAAAPALSPAQKSGSVQVWLTNADKSALFEAQKPLLRFSPAKSEEPTIEIDDQKTFQTVDGFGFALTGGSAQHLAHMDARKRASLLKELFAVDAGNIGISYLRISIGSSDLNDHVFSYDDLPGGGTDPQLAKFSLAPDGQDLIPVLKEILAINPEIQLLGSPWSPPAWMKTNNNPKGGRLRTEDYAVYANYFLKYLQEMRAEGITVGAITIQNEPLNDKNTPSMLMSAEEQALFLKDDLGPAFKVAGVHNAFPLKNLYFTEFMAVEPTESGRISIAKPVVGTFIGALGNWSRNVLLWNLAANSKFEPHTDNGGCPICQGAVTIDSDKVTRNLAYYAMAHFSKFVRPGSVRIASSSPATLPNIAFKAADGKAVLIVVNEGKSRQDFRVQYR